jgi:hypothetical protein
MCIWKGPAIKILDLLQDHTTARQLPPFFKPSHYQLFLFDASLFDLPLVFAGDPSIRWISRVSPKARRLR